MYSSEAKYKITVFTPAYNRAHTLPKLYQSLFSQGNLADFEWLIVDDCSTDGTQELVNKFFEEGKIQINYIRLEQNGGKPRAINVAVDRARSPYLFIVDSDDYLAPNIIPELISQIDTVKEVSDINAVGVMRGHPDGTCFAQPTFDKYVDATNLQRKDFGIDVDCNEAYKISVLKNYPFIVWPGEIFTPESTVLNSMALDGYKIRWLNRIGVISEYQEDGMTKNSWGLQRKNPMGYAMLFNSNLLHQKGLKQRFYTATQFAVQCLLGKNPGYILKSNAPLLTMASFPTALMIYLRRIWQYRSV